MPELNNEEYDLFISYSSVDVAWAERLAGRLEKEDYEDRKLRVFLDRWDIRPGQFIPERIEAGLKASRKVAIILTPEAMASSWVKMERMVNTWIAVSERSERIIPLYLRTCDIPPLLKSIAYIDFRDESRFDDGYHKLCAVLRDEPMPRGLIPDPTPAYSHTLPRPPVVGFVARRDKEGRDLVARLQQELDPNKNQLVALWGPGGVGKTTLAAEAAREMSAVFGPRIAWISADGRADLTLGTLLDEIAAQFGRPDLRTLAPAPKGEAVCALLAAAPALVVLDNFETVATAEQVRCAEFLHQRAPCPALITTRERVNPARNVAIYAMSLPEAHEFLARLIAETRSPDTLSGPDRDRIIQTAGANPLVMQWIVAQIDLAQAPRTVLDDLAHGEGDAAQRVFDRSFNLPQVGAAGRDTLLALSLFVPSASREALAEAAGFGDELKRLNEAVKHLSALWLVGTTVGGERLMVEGLTRELARAHLARDPRAGEFRKRFVTYFLRYAKAHAKPTPEDFDALEAEKDNLLTAMDVAFEGRDWDSVIQLVYLVASPGILYTRGYWDQALHYAQQGIVAAHQANREQDVANLAHDAAIMQADRGELTEARRLYGESLDINKKLGDQQGIASSLHQFGNLAKDQGELAEARRLYDESLDIKKKLGNQQGIASSLHQFGNLAKDQGELAEARRLYGESLDINKKLGNQQGIAYTLGQLGTLARLQGRFDEAKENYKQVLDISNQLGDQASIAIGLHQLGMLEEIEGKKPQAVQLFHEALTI
ncbi:MAG: tetratricopeptide repeat protein [Anaerolineae bacterium]